MGLDKSGLNNILFEEFDNISSERHIYMCNIATGVSRWSKGIVEYFGLPGEYMYDAGNIWAEHIHIEDRQKYIDEIDDVFAGRKEVHDMTYRARNKEGNYVLCSCHGRIMTDELGRTFFVGTINNYGILGNVDAITSLYNIYEFSNRMKMYRLQDKMKAVLEIGINNFSRINEVYGYDFGNKVLSNFATQIREAVKDKGGEVFRMDGVRFATCIDYEIRDKVREIYDAFRDIAHHKIIIDGTRVSLTISGGVAYYTQMYDERTIGNSLEYALHQSKYNKQGQLVIFEDSKYNDNINLSKSLEAIRDCAINGFEGFYMCYQPIVSSENHKVIGAEALLRWRKDPIGEVPPGVFIPWLENDPCFFDLSNWILKTSIMETKQLLEEYPDFVLNINLAYPQLSNPEFINCLSAILKETGYNPNNLCLELTERCRYLESNELRAVVDKMKSMGIKVALDDFGTGFSSLNILGVIPIDTLKIDRQFINNIQETQANQAIVQAVSECAKMLDIHVCTEGIETEEMIDFLKRYYVYSYQGYYFSRPIPIDDFVTKYSKK